MGIESSFRTKDHSGFLPVGGGGGGGGTRGMLQVCMCICIICVWTKCVGQSFFCKILSPYWEVPLYTCTHTIVHCACSLHRPSATGKALLLPLNQQVAHECFIEHVGKDSVILKLTAKSKQAW